MIPIIHQSGKLLYEQIYEFYREAILHKQLPYNYRLPSHRMLARELGIGINTVLRAYEQLIHEGYVRNENRKGLFVARIESGDWQVGNTRAAEQEPAPKKKQKTAVEFKLTDQIVDESSFPLKDWRKCTNLALDNMRFQYESAELSDPLKEQLIRYLYDYRGVVTTPERLLIGSGTNALLFWLAFVLRKTHSRIAFEEPGYHRPRFLFSELGYSAKAVPVNADGLDVQQLRRIKADLLYLTPSHQFPTGGAIPVGNRIQILKWARKNKAYIIEDDFDSEFRYKTRLMPSLQGLDTFNTVIYTGTFSNALMPSLRVAYMVMPANFPVDYAEYMYLTNTVPYITRRTLAYFIEKGYWERHLKRMRKVYQEKYDACIAALRKLPAGDITFNDNPSGLNILLRVHTRNGERELIERATRHGIVIRPASVFYAEARSRPRHPEILFEFSALPLQAIDRVIRKLHTAWFTE